VSGYPYVPPPAAGYTGLPPSPYGMPPPGHPSDDVDVFLYVVDPVVCGVVYG
jgi:hypothetical protein